MQIVINISEESYKNIKEQVDKRDYPDMEIGRAIADGKPLTQGHWLTHKEYCDKNNLLPSGYGSYYWCSECGCGIDSSAFHQGRYDYCPTCGADMRCDSSEEDYKNRVIGVDLNHAEKSMVEMTKRANDFVHEKRSEGITVIPAREFFEAIGIIDFFFGNDVGIDISNFKGE